jgi:hypothetical protein
VERSRNQSQLIEVNTTVAEQEDLQLWVSTIVRAHAEQVRELFRFVMTFSHAGSYFRQPCGRSGMNRIRLFSLIRFRNIDLGFLVPYWCHLLICSHGKRTDFFYIKDS